MKKKLLLLTLLSLLVTSGCSNNKCLLDYKLTNRDVLRLEVTDKYNNTTLTNYINSIEKGYKYEHYAILETTYRWRVYTNYFILTTYEKAYDEETKKSIHNSQYSYYYSDTKVKWQLEIY